MGGAVVDQLIDGGAFLVPRVALAHGHCLVFQRGEVDGGAERRRRGLLRARSDGRRRAPRASLPRLARLAPDADWCNLIVWSADSKRVAFLVSDAIVYVYDSQSNARVFAGFVGRRSWDAPPRYTLRDLALSTLVDVEACEYPDSQKVLILAGPRGERQLRRMFRAESTVDYYDREQS